jgi:biotin operon repressor
MSVSMQAALGFGKLWKTTEELQALTGLSYDDTLKAVRELQKRGFKIAETYQDGSYLYCMAERMVTV